MISFYLTYNIRGERMQIYFALFFGNRHISRKNYAPIRPGDLDTLDPRLAWGFFRGYENGNRSRNVKIRKKKNEGAASRRPTTSAFNLALGLPHARSTTTRAVAHHRTVSSLTTVIVGCCFPGLDFIIQPFLIKIALKLRCVTLQS
jgi:hypothetical protein